MVSNVKNAYAIFSLTMHPTNPTSTIYTLKGGIEFDQCLEKNIDYGEHLKIIQDLPSGVTTIEAREAELQL